MDPEDYFDEDDLVLDESVLAVLDREENKFKEAQRATQQQAVGERRPADAPPPLPPPPQKRQKTSHEHSGEPSVSQPAEDDEGLPEISVFSSGNYLFPGAQRGATNGLAAQMRAPSADVIAAILQRPPSPVRHPAPAPPVRNSSVARSTSGSGPSTLGQAQGRLPAALPPRSGQPSAAQQSNRPPGTVQPRRSSTLSSIQAALAGFAPPPSNPATNVRTSRHSPAPAPAPGPSRAPANVPHPKPSSPALAPSQPRTLAQPAAPVASHVSRPSAPPNFTSVANRRQSVPAAVRPRTPSPAQPRPPPPQPPPPSQGQSDRSLRLELDTLKVQLEELLKAQEHTNKALQEAQNARYAKEGEVSILRKNMEKTAKEHAAEVARIKAAREQAEAVQAQLRKEMAEERERLRTQYMFKQHELETNLRKTPWSVRIKRNGIDNQGPMTPVSASTQRRQAAANGQNANAGPSSVFQTPSRVRVGESLPTSPTRQRRKNIVDSPPPKKPVKLPGFYNAFEPSPLKTSLQFSQLSQSTQVRGKGKDRVEETSFDFRDPPAEDLFFNPKPTVDDARQRSSPPSSPPAHDEPREDNLIPDVLVRKNSSGPSSSAEPATSSPAEDVEMKDVSTPVEPQTPQEPLQVPDWTKELHRIVLTHKYGGWKQPTLQLLIIHTIPSSAHQEHAQEYSSQSARLFECLGTTALKAIDPDDVIQSVQHTLSAMGRVLCAVGSISPLAALLDLLKVLALFIPSFVSLALTPYHGGGNIDAPPEILLLLCEAVRDHLTPPKGGLDETRTSFARDVIGLLEVICWYTPPELAMRLSLFVRKAGVLSALINPAQPTWLVQRTVRALTLAASYCTLWRDFLSFPLSEAPTHEAAEKDFSRIPHIEQLAAFLIDRTRDGPEGRPFRDAILNFVTTLAVAHNDALSILLQSHSLLPSIIVFLHNTTAPIWEDGEDLMQDDDLVTWTVKMTARTVLLLHHLMTNADSTRINLRHKLMLPPRRFANSLWHMFTVSLGRISYAFPPEWAGMENATRLDQICDLAKEVLEVAVDGPELESIWAAFQVDDNVPDPRQMQYEDEEPRSAVPSVIELD